MKKVLTVFLVITMMLSLLSCDFNSKSDIPNLKKMAYCNRTIDDLFMYAMPSHFTGMFSHLFYLEDVKKEVNNFYMQKEETGSVGIARLQKPEAYVFFFFDQNERLVDGMYITKLFSEDAFQGLSVNKSSLSDVQKIDSNTFTLECDDLMSYHWLVNGNIVCIQYNKNSKKISAMFVISDDNSLGKLTKSELEYLKTIGK